MHEMAALFQPSGEIFGLASHDLFDTDVCNLASGREKGVVETNVQDSRRRIWQEAGTQALEEVGGAPGGESGEVGA
jgi:hypothetical protein